MRCCAQVKLKVNVTRRHASSEQEISASKEVSKADADGAGEQGEQQEELEGWWIIAESLRGGYGAKGRKQVNVLQSKAVCCVKSTDALCCVVSRLRCAAPQRNHIARSIAQHYIAPPAAAVLLLRLMRAELPY